MTIDLRGIGDVRPAVADVRGPTDAALARQALLASTDQVVALVSDLPAFIRLLAKLDLRGMQPSRKRMHPLDGSRQSKTRSQPR